MSKSLLLSAAICLYGFIGGQEIFGQSCGCDRPICRTCTKCNSCEHETTHVTLHVKTADDSCCCDNGCRKKCCLFRRPSINIAPAMTTTQVAVAPQVQRVAVPAVAYQPMQTVALAPYQPLFTSMQSGVMQQYSTRQQSGQSCCEQLDDKVAELATEVAKISDRVNKLIDVVDRHDQVLKSLVNQR